MKKSIWRKETENKSYDRKSEWKKNRKEKKQVNKSKLNKLYVSILQYLRSIFEYKLTMNIQLKLKCMII